MVASACIRQWTWVTVGSRKDLVHVRFQTFISPNDGVLSIATLRTNFMGIRTTNHPNHFSSMDCAWKMSSAKFRPFCSGHNVVSLPWRVSDSGPLRGWVLLYDDVIKWKHFPCYWPFVRGIHRSTVNSPHKGQWRGALMFSLIYAWINDWVNSRKAGDLRRHRAHYDVIVM